MRDMKSALLGATAATALIFLGAVGARANQTLPVVRASRIDLVDGDGHTRARLSLENGHPDLVFYSQDGKPVSAIGVTNATNPYVSLHRSGGGLGITLGNTDSGDPNISLFGAGGKPLAILGLMPGDKPGILFKDPVNQSAASLMGRPSGDYQLVLTGKDGKLRIPVLTGNQ